MTRLCELIIECRAIGIDDRVILYGWAAQLEDGNDTVYASKETVAEFLGLCVRTMQRRTKALVKLGLMIDTGERKQWRFGWTPVYTINVPMIMGFCQGDNLSGRQFVAQGSTRSLVLGVNLLYSSFPATGGDTGLQPVGVKSAPPTDGLEPKTEKPITNPKSKTCPKCNLPWTRDKNHKCCPDADNEPLGDSYGEDAPIPKSLDPDFANYGGEQMPLNPDGSIDMDKWRGVSSKTAEDRVRQKTVQSTVAEEKPTPCAQSPHSAAPPFVSGLC